MRSSTASLKVPLTKGKVALGFLRFCVGTVVDGLILARAAGGVDAVRIATKQDGTEQSAGGLTETQGCQQWWPVISHRAASAKLELEAIAFPTPCNADDFYSRQK
mmetsp:Transcript_44413/g.96530  ORF Transcript_44413/g.96530 Transcript_44413/m.96530 type:complete len:105 (+) Transcript_44413:1462-1776(+)